MSKKTNFAKMKIYLSAYKRINKEIILYEEELQELTEKKIADPKYEEFYEETENALTHCEKQKKKNLEVFKEMFYKVEDENQKEIMEQPEYKESQEIINRETYA